MKDTPDTREIDLSDWIGRHDTSLGCVSAEQAAMVHATLSAPGAAPQTGDALPALWHWCGFAPAVGMEDLGPDGHPRAAGIMPPIPLERRMWASGALTFHAPLHVGEVLSRRSTVSDIVQKQGGAMYFVTLTHEISGAHGLAICERQNIVYLRIPDTFVPPRKLAAPTEPTIAELVPVNQALLFRYSAITFNAHRIHYDMPYASEVERYPGLVVHGPMQATLLMQMATQAKGRAPDSFEFRAVHPMFHFDDLRLLATPGEDGALALCTASPDGHQGLQATAKWEEPTS
ncbi:MAG: MaoC family dehydratase N-terminal domain-containing protein [Sedimentitalea sp.]